MQRGKNSQKYCHESIGIGIGNTFCRSIAIGIDNSQLLTSLSLSIRVCDQKSEIGVSWYQ